MYTQWNKDKFIDAGHRSSKGIEMVTESQHSPRVDFGLSQFRTILSRIQGVGSFQVPSGLCIIKYGIDMLKMFTIRHWH